MYPYEGMFLLDPVAHTADSEAVEKTVTSLIEKHGGKIRQADPWEERRLAYEIKGHRRGIYLLVYFEMPGENVDAMRRETRITETILRQLVIRLQWDFDTFFEKSKAYQEKVREDQEGRRGERIPEGAVATTPTPEAPQEAVKGEEAAAG